MKARGQRGHGGGVTKVRAKAVRRPRDPCAPPTAVTLAKYGLTAADWIAIFERQGRSCAVCRVVGKPLCVDHDHAIGWRKMSPEKRAVYCRGLVCWWCNSRFLGRAISLDRARRVVAYLEAYEERRREPFEAPV